MRVKGSEGDVCVSMYKTNTFSGGREGNRERIGRRKGEFLPVYVLGQ